MKFIVNMVEKVKNQFIKEIKVLFKNGVKLTIIVFYGMFKFLFFVKISFGKVKIEEVQFKSSLSVSILLDKVKLEDINKNKIFFFIKEEAIKTERFMSMYFFISRLSSVDSIDIVEDSFQSLGSLFKGSLLLNFLIRNVLDGKVSFYFGG